MALPSAKSNDARTMNRHTALGPALGIVFLFAAVSLLTPMRAAAQPAFVSETHITTVIDELAAKYGDGERVRLDRGIRQAARFWREEDGSPDQFAEVCRQYYIADPGLRQQTADRFETALAGIYGHQIELGRDLSWNLDVVTGPILPIDYLFGQYSPGAHFSDDMFKTRIAFVALLNFPLYTLEELLKRGPELSRDEWAQARLVESFASRVPPEASLKIGDAHTAAGMYISEYNIYMHHLLAPDGSRPFPEGKRLITHWNLRDELKALYADPDGLARQEMIYDVMQRIIRQEIPAIVINNPAVDWNLSTNTVTVSPVIDGDVPSQGKVDGPPGQTVANDREPDTRYKQLLAIFQAHHAADPFYPDMPSMIDRRFKRGREMLETDVENIFKSIMTSETVAKIGHLIERRLGRPLRPFDIWYDGFKTRQKYPEAELDRIVREKYPTAEAFRADLGNILRKLGFDDAMADYLVSRVEVDPSRGPGHASAPGLRTDKAHLRTRVDANGMDYKGYNIAIHELGHNIEQLFSLNKVDHTLLRGVPNTAFTECFAYLFQDRDLELLGLAGNDPLSRHLFALDELWGIYEISGVALVDMKVWHWMYDHPDATPAELKEAVIAIAKNIWNEYYAPVFGVKDIDLLAIYSHMIESALYLPDYSLGGVIANQIKAYMEGKDTAEEMERMCSLGSITPDLWMNLAVGSPISTAPMLRAAEEALRVVGE